MIKIFYTIRSLFFYCVIGVDTILLGVAFLMHQILGLSRESLFRICRFYARLNFRGSTCRLKLAGLENIPDTGSAVYISNHQGYFDVLAIVGFIPRDMVMVSKSAIFRIPIFGWGMNKAGFISVDRNDPQSRKEVVPSVVDRVKRNLSVHIFPEGTRTPDGSIQEFKPGAFLAAQSAGVPLVPVMIYGSYDVIRKKDFQIYPGLITMEILPPVMVPPNEDGDVSDVVEKVRQMIVDSFEKEKQRRGDIQANG